MTRLFLDLSAPYRELKPQIDSAISRVLASDWYFLGPEVDRLRGRLGRIAEKHS